MKASKKIAGRYSIRLETTYTNRTIQCFCKNSKSITEKRAILIESHRTSEFVYEEVMYEYNK